jgi:DNA repair exonuclease SbcCD ATPase subunit
MMLKLWMSPLRPVEENLEVADGEITRLRAELEAAKAEIEHLKQSRENFAAHAENSLQQIAAKDAEIEEINLLKREVKELLSKKFSRFANEECWIYQGDGEDHLESLVCPVVISASRLLEIEKQRDELLATLKRTADDLAYVAYNIDGLKLDDLPVGLVESTGVSETAIIAERNCRAAIASVKGETG